jgi:spermidine synthase
LIVVFSLSLFVSATLLFWVQPMFAKMSLPLLGGTPAVWNTTMVFFQAILLGGYLYAHAVTRWLGLKRQVVLHFLLLLSALLLMPVGVAANWTPPATANPVLWLFLLLFVSLGLPAFMISSTAPLLQGWFVHTGHHTADDPYFLYAASNAGSMAALLGYPLFLEPWLKLSEQSAAWTGGYVLLMLLMAACAVIAWKRFTPAPVIREGEDERWGSEALQGDIGISWNLRLVWFFLSFAPASLLLGVTTHISTDIAAVPLLWVVPLALYLLTFILVFGRRKILPHQWMVFAQPFVVLPLVYVFMLGWGDYLSTFPLHLLAFFICAMVCHGELAKTRPAARYLTEFYLWLSFGGVMGGLFNTLAAPVVFDSVAEYPLAFALACFLRPGPDDEGPGFTMHWSDILQPAMLALAAGGVIFALQTFTTLPAAMTGRKIVVLAALGLLYALFRKRPLRFGASVGFLLLLGAVTSATSGNVLLQERNFFGKIWVTEDTGERFHSLNHGRAVHGAQHQDPSLRRDPLTYYTREGPLGNLYSALTGPYAPEKIGIIGLGAGTIAAYGQPGQKITFFEIDPDMERVARDSTFFTYLQDCPAEVDIVLGDARLTLARTQDRNFDLIVVDAFSSDAIPIHLITKEALALYVSKLTDKGVLAFNISNRYLDLEPVLARIAAELKLIAITNRHLSASVFDQISSMKSNSTWVVMTRQWQHIGYLPMIGAWRTSAGKETVDLWTDDFSNIVSVFQW